MTLACEYEGCTIGDTARCALENDPDTCPHRIRLDAAQGSDTDDAGAPVLNAPEEAPAFPLSTTLGSEAIMEMMAQRYVNVVGILGDPESGKTACLVSLYLMVAAGKLKGWSFADSKSLMGFEDIARGARRWNDQGNAPEQMTVHTEIANDRIAGFLHLRLKRNSDGRRIDLALPDLPGEWTKALVRTSEMDRFEFMRSSEVIWIVVDGRTLNNRELRQGCITRLGQLAGRLKQLMQAGSMPRLLLVVTHRDAGAVSDDVLKRVATELEKHDAKATTISVASFVEGDADVKPGFGLDDLINATIAEQTSTPVFWPSPETPEGARSYLSFRRHHDG